MKKVLIFSSILFRGFQWWIRIVEIIPNINFLQIFEQGLCYILSFNEKLADDNISTNFAEANESGTPFK